MSLDLKRCQGRTQRLTQSKDELLAAVYEVEDRCQSRLKLWPGLARVKSCIIMCPAPPHISGPANSNASNNRRSSSSSDVTVEEDIAADPHVRTWLVQKLSFVTWKSPSNFFQPMRMGLLQGSVTTVCEPIRKVRLTLLQENISTRTQATPVSCTTLMLDVTAPVASWYHLHQCEPTIDEP